MPRKTAGVIVVISVVITVVITVVIYCGYYSHHYCLFPLDEFLPRGRRHFFFKAYVSTQRYDVLPEVNCLLTYFIKIYLN